MTINKFGKVTPTQMDMLMLIGYRLSRGDTTLSIPDNERVNIVISGRKNLCRTTDVDLKYDLLAWHHFLIEHKEFGYTHPYSFKNVEKAVLGAKLDTMRDSLISRLRAIERSSLNLPGLGPTTPAQIAMLRLVGYRLSETEATLAIPDDERMNNMMMGRKALGNMIGLDFGFDLRDWQRFLIEHQEYNYSYPYAFERLKQIVRHQRDNKDRATLVLRISRQS